MKLKINKTKVICRRCKWYPRVLNATSDDIPICKLPLFSSENSISGKTNYVYCIIANENGDCSYYQQR